jgi:hypothetical protein
VVEDRRHRPIRWERQAKPRGGERWVARLDPRDDATYRRLVAPIVPAIERSLGPGVFSHRAFGSASVRPWPRARQAWRRATRSTIAGVEDVTLVVSDVRDCYGSMGERALAALAVGDDLVAFLRALSTDGIRGLPIGPDPSAILANGILSIADREVAAAGCHPIRWVDDVILVAAGRRSAQRGFDAWRRSLERLGLEAHDGKTRWAVGRSDAILGIGFCSGSDPGAVPRAIIPAP